MDEPQYIEVVGSALITRPIEVYRGTIKITVTTRKTKTGLNLSLRLRDQVIAALASAGIDPSDIQDAGGSIGHSNWSSKKQLAHELQIENKDMQVFAQAMASVEQVFTAEKSGFFSGVSADFSFTVDEPRYAKTEEANEQALKDAISNATRKARLLTDAAGVELGQVDRITELNRPMRPRSSIYEPEDPTDFDEHLAMRGLACAEDPFVDYTPVSPKQTTGVVQVRLRFRIEHA